MQPPLDAEPAARRIGGPMLPILWPAFLMAGVLEALVFSVIDPSRLHPIGGGAAAGGSESAVYTLAFWLVTSTASALTVLLLTEP